jgi:hypothetical protein
MTQTIINLGTGGAALNGQNGSTASADSNDALFLDWPGDNAGNYVYLSGAAGNRFQVPDEAAFAVTNHDVRVRCSLDSWASGSVQSLVSQFFTADLAFDFRMTAPGRFQVRFSIDGTTIIAASAVDPLSPLTGSIWVRFTRNASTGVVSFFVAPDQTDEPASGDWVLQGTTTSTTGTVFNSSGALQVGTVTNTSQSAAGKFYRAIMKNDIDGTTTLDIDTSVITAGNQTTFTALTGQTVTINRSTSGRKSVAVVSPVWLFGTDDYMEVADNALLDFDATGSFTIVAAYRAWATFATNAARVAKKADTTAATRGWLLGSDGTTAALPRLQAGDGANGASAIGPARTSGALTITAGVRNVATDTLTTYMNGTAGTAVTDTTTGSLANAEVMRIGRLSGAGTGYADMELLTVAVFRRALSAAEISVITSYYQARLS